MLFSSLFFPLKILFGICQAKRGPRSSSGSRMRLCCTHFQKKMKQWHHQQKHGSKICVWRQQLQFSASSCHQRKWHWFDMWPKYEKANTAAWCYWLRASTVILAPAITGPSKGDTCVIFMILFAYRKSYTFLAKAV